MDGIGPAHLKFYRSMIPSQMLSSITLQCESWRQIETLYALISAHRCSITNLNVSVTRLVDNEYWELYDIDSEEPPAELVPCRWRRLGEALFSCPHLEVLELGIPYYTPVAVSEWDPLDGEVPSACRTIFEDIFSSSIPTSVRVVVVQLYGLYEAEHGFGIEPDLCHLWDLSTLDGVLLDRARLPHFQTLVIRLNVSPKKRPTWSSELRTFYAYVSGMLPRLHKADRIVWEPRVAGFRWDKKEVVLSKLPT
ncbi:hypothetical protein OH76DRAFT_273114 [Lentinus brumalis]|uniref:F-box domain-containing protein n=1 Tax=Lentinus brumalis TaxID=2498619 RepID=A0A371DH04_9APHY|nr:hypothetical protein OH76DRAFT_273114 [Polyporus brumalis]